MAQTSSKKIMRHATAVMLSMFFCLSGSAQQTSDQHHQEVIERGDRVMGFSHEKTIHHFRLFPDGGSIEALATNPSDATSRQEIREHLQHIAMMFSQGNFNAPMLIHARTPPGVPTMKKLRTEIRYQVEDLPAGVRVRVSSQNPEAVNAIHEFLKFQIRDHQTGDTTAIDPGT
ncbi:MAG TPA: hypothetical protein VM912_19740 [Terriglobales bacterium]|nr:hypothetical protein [Terriglobales bacterium]